MAVTLKQWSESNGGTAGSPGSTTDGISNSNYGSADSANIVTTTNPIAPNSYSYAKQHRIKFTVDAGETIDNFRFWKQSGTLSGSDAIQYDAPLTYQTPTNASIAGTTIPTSLPGAENIGLAALVAPSATYTEYFRHQLFVHSATTAGASGIVLRVTFDRIVP